jgi:uncharacterized damage-inducible protein DinB
MDVTTPSPNANLERLPWAKREFAFVHPPWMLADFVERLRGLIPRLGPLVAGVPEEISHRQLDGKWSMAQNLGHLSDVEELWQERLEDLRQGRASYTAADSTRFQAAAMRHPQRSLAATVEELVERRRRLVDALANASPSLQTASAVHLRLQKPMRLVDCAQFYAEHDDHHLLRTRALRSILGVHAD